MDASKQSQISRFECLVLCEVFSLTSIDTGKKFGYCVHEGQREDSLEERI